MPPRSTTPDAKPTASAPAPVVESAPLPPGVPEHMRGMVLTRSTPTAVAAVAAPAVHPTFAAPDRTKAEHRAKAAALRASLIAGLDALRRDDAKLAEAIAYVDKSPEAAAVFASEGIDLALVKTFHSELQKLIALTSA